LLLYHEITNGFKLIIGIVNERRFAGSFRINIGRSCHSIFKKTTGGICIPPVVLCFDGWIVSKKNSSLLHPYPGINP